MIVIQDDCDTRRASRLDGSQSSSSDLSLKNESKQPQKPNVTGMSAPSDHLMSHT